MRVLGVICLSCVPLLLSALGCAKQRPVRREPLAVPPAREVALDPQLRVAADHELSESLLSSDPIIRVHALEGIRDSNGVQHKAEILHALDDTEARVRFAAALAAGELKIAEAHDRLLAIADDRSENVRVAVRFALHRLGDSRLTHDLEKTATDSSPLVRGNTAFVLGMLGEPSALTILRQLRNDPEAPVRQQASEAMWRLGDEDGLQDLVAMSVSGHPDDQMIAYMALAGPRNSRVRQHIRLGLVGEEGNGADREKWLLAVPLVAARAMGMLGSDEGYGVALKAAASDDPQLRMLAALAFGAIGRTDAQDSLRRLLGDNDPSVRIAAATAILQLKTR